MQFEPNLYSSHYTRDTGTQTQQPASLSHLLNDILPTPPLPIISSPQQYLECPSFSRPTLDRVLSKSVPKMYLKSAHEFPSSPHPSSLLALKTAVISFKDLIYPLLYPVLISTPIQLLGRSFKNVYF